MFHPWVSLVMTSYNVHVHPSHSITNSNIILVFVLQDRIEHLQAQTQQFVEVGHFDVDSIQDKSGVIVERYEKYVTKQLICGLPFVSKKFVGQSVWVIFLGTNSYNCLLILRVTYASEERRSKLLESNNLHQFYRDIDDEESWIK